VNAVIPFDNVSSFNVQGTCWPANSQISVETSNGLSAVSPCASVGIWGVAFDFSSLPWDSSVGFVVTIRSGSQELTLPERTARKEYCQGSRLSQLPFANSDDSTAGVAGNPYLICTADQMNRIGASSSYWSKHYKLMRDIDLSSFQGDEFAAIGASFNSSGAYVASSPGFSGTFDGNHFALKNLHYSLRYRGRHYCGLFNFVEGGRIKDLTLDGFDFFCSARAYYGSGSHGILMGLARDADISNVHIINSKIIGGGGGYGAVGAIAGRVNGGAYRDSSVVASTAKLTNDTYAHGWQAVGLFFGSVAGGGSSTCVYVDRSMAQGLVDTLGINWHTDGWVGGFNGSVDWAGCWSTFRNIYSRVDVRNSTTVVPSGSAIGLFSGAINWSTLENIWVTGALLGNAAAGRKGGFSGLNGGTVAGSGLFWSTSASGIAFTAAGISGGVSGVSDALLKTPTTYGLDWDTTIWHFETGQFPKLQWELPAND
jgi:hypothetical protein